MDMDIKKYLLISFLILIIIIPIILLICVKPANQLSETQKIYQASYRDNNKIPHIPKTIYITYKNKNIQHVINNWKKLNPGYDVKLYDDKDCLDFLQKEFGKEYCNLFNFLKDGPIKSDFWRCCILYKYGGVYADADIEPLIGIDTFIEKNISFLSVASAIKNQVNPHLIITYANNIILKKCIDKFFYKYNNKIKYSYWGYSIVQNLTDVIKDRLGQYINYEGIYYDENNYKYQFISEEIFFDNTKNRCKYNNKIILNNRYSNYINHSF